MNVHPIIGIIRGLNLALIFLCLVAWTYIYFKCRMPGLLAAITWLGDVFFFYVFRMWVVNNPTQLNIDIINLWATVIIAHGLILLLLAAWVIKFSQCDLREFKQEADK